MTTRTIDTSVLEILSRAQCSKDQLILPHIPDRTVYLKAASVIEDIGGKWVKSRKAHVFDDGEAEVILEGVLLTGIVERVPHQKQVLGQFDSPEWLGQKMAAILEATYGMDILEPSIGIGRLALPLANRGADVYGAEIDEKRGREALAAHERIRGVSFGDFLTMNPGSLGLFEACAMNPTFYRRGDLDHVLHAMTFLRKGGKLAAVMSDGITFRSDSRTEKFHQRMSVLAEHWDLEPLPEKTFKVASVRTVLVTATARGV